MGGRGMIDTDRYENITPERWTVDKDDPFRVVDAQDCTIARTDFVDIDEERGWQLANARLISLAPLLLEEVKELRAWKAEVERICRTMSGPNRDTALFIMTNEVEEE
jgi:hypothetical protein